MTWIEKLCTPTSRSRIPGKKHVLENQFLVSFAKWSAAYDKLTDHHSISSFVTDKKLRHPFHD
jgi:hypothetical protein